VGGANTWTSAPDGLPMKNPVKCELAAGARSRTTDVPAATIVPPRVAMPWMIRMGCATVSCW
jgi:hypothetical protein